MDDNFKLDAETREQLEFCASEMRWLATDLLPKLLEAQAKLKAAHAEGGVNDG